MSNRKIVRGLRRFRVFHRWVGITIAIFLLISCITGVLLSLKKEIELLQPSTQKGSSTDLMSWKSIDDLNSLALTALKNSDSYSGESNSILRLDVRPGKGVVKAIFEEDNWEVQLDGTTGEVLSIGQRNSDWIESIHDGSIISDIFKLISMNLLGWGVVFMIITGLWLYYGPKRYRRLRKKKQKS